jgi:hypothetical protein
MPIKVEEAELLAAVGDAGEEAQGAALQPGMNGLDIINAVHKAIYGSRTILNGQVDTQEKHAAELERALPPAGDVKKWGDEATRLATGKSRIESLQNSEIKDLGDQFQAVKDREAKAERDAHAAADAACAAAKATATKQSHDAIEAARTIANAEASRIKAENKPRLDALTAEHATAVERARAEQQAEGTRAAAKVARDEAAAKRARSQALTAALDRLTDLKSVVASRLSIPGIKIEDGRIWREESGKLVPLPQWNMAGKMTLCLKIAVLAHGDAGFVLIDGAERISPTNFPSLVKACKKYAEEKGMQFIIAKVAEGQLKVGAPE